MKTKTQKFFGGVFAQCFFIAVVALGVAGCSILPPEKYHPVNVYDLGTPANICPAGVQVDVQTFMNESPSKGKMLYRVSKNRVESDDSNRWAQGPSTLLTSYLQTAFGIMNAASPAARYTVSGSITAFEIDLPEHLVRLGLVYKITDSSANVLVRKSGLYTQAFDKENPDDFAIAMQGAALKFSDEIRQELAKLKNMPSEPKIEKR